MLVIDLEYRARGHRLAAFDPLRTQVVKEYQLVREGVRGITGQIVERELVVVKEAGRPGRWHDVAGPDRLDVAHGPV